MAQLDDPRTIAEPLRGPELGRFWKFHVGDWRLICHIEDHLIRILVLRIGTRSPVLHKPHRGPATTIPAMERSETLPAGGVPH